jgi:hypothetical protein
MLAPENVQAMLIRSLGGQDRRGAEILQSAGETMSDDEGRMFSSGSGSMICSCSTPRARSNLPSCEQCAFPKLIAAITTVKL